MAALVDRRGHAEATSARAAKRADGTPSRMPDAVRSRNAENAVGMGETFRWLLRHYRLRTGLFQNAFAKAAAVDTSYIHRLEAGQRGTPTRHVVDALAHALALAPEERAGLHAAAGYMPHDSTVATVLRLLTDDRRSPASRADFRAVVETIVARWERPFQLAGPCPTHLGVGSTLPSPDDSNWRPACDAGGRACALGGRSPLPSGATVGVNGQD